MFSVRQVEAFKAVMRTGSMKAAAEILFVTQSAISKLIKEFESELGFELFLRTRGGLVPSAEAQSLLPEVERLFVGLEKIRQAAGRIQSRKHGHLRIVAMPALTTGFLQGAIADFTRSHPAVSVSLEAYNSAEVVELVASGQFDLGYARTPINRERGLHPTVWQVDCVYVLPPRHRLRRKQVVQARDLSNEPFVSLAGGNATRQKIDALFESLNIERQLAFEAGWSAAVAGFVAKGMGAAILDPFTADTARAMGCSVHPMAEPVALSFAEVLPEASASNALAQAFRPHVRDHLGRTCPEVLHRSGRLRAAALRQAR